MLTIFLGERVSIRWQKRILLLASMHIVRKLSESD